MLDGVFDELHARKVVGGVGPVVYIFVGVSRISASPEYFVGFVGPGFVVGGLFDILLDFGEVFEDHPGIRYQKLQLL